MTFSHWAVFSHSSRSMPVIRFTKPSIRRLSLFHPRASVSA